MTDKTLSQIVGGANKVLTMPISVGDSTLLELKDGTGAERQDTEATFYTALERDFSTRQFDVDTLSVVADTTEQTITDITTSGILTNVLSPRIASASGVMTIRVTIDGDVTSFTATLLVANSTTMLLGDITEAVTTGSTTNVGTGSSSDTGFVAGTAVKRGLMTPSQVVARGISGMVFKTSLKVTVQGSAALTAGSATHKAAALYTTYIPKGF